MNYKYNKSYIDKYEQYNDIGQELEYKYKIELINYIYMYLDLYSLRICIMKTKEHAQQLKQQQYHITPHFNGYNYLLIFKKLSDNITRAYMIYKMDLKFNKNDVDPNYVKIYKLDIINRYIDDYDNTIIDGKLVYKKEQKIYLISDLYYFGGQKYLSMKIVDKYDIIDPYIQDINSILKYIFDIKLIRIYKYSELSNLVYNKIKNSDFKINGLVFIPYRSGKVLIYTNDTEFENIKNSPNLDIVFNIKNIKISTENNLKNQTLMIQKTQIIDVYEVFTLDKTYRFGICCIPTIELSHKLRDHFKNSDYLITECIFNNKFLKWMPII